MLPRADFSSQPDAAAAELFASVRAPAPCTRMNVASAAAASAAGTTRLVTSPPSVRFPLPGREPRHRRRRYGRRGGDAEVTKWGLGGPGGTGLLSGGRWGWRLQGSRGA